MDGYRQIQLQIEAVSNSIPWDITVLSNACAILYKELDCINWCGFYLVRNHELQLGPFQGKVACAVIPFGQGVCGTAFIKNQSLIVEDVHKFAGHIACDSASNSEIVVPIHDNHNSIYGILDIDSPEFNRFSDSDKNGLECIVHIIEKAIFNK